MRHSTLGRGAGGGRDRTGLQIVKYSLELILWAQFLYLCCSHAFQETLTQKDNADSGVQFITPAGPRQSALSQGPPTSFCENHIYPKCMRPNPPPQIP